MGGNHEKGENSGSDDAGGGDATGDDLGGENAIGADVGGDHNRHVLLCMLSMTLGSPQVSWDIFPI